MTACRELPASNTLILLLLLLEKMPNAQLTRNSQLLLASFCLQIIFFSFSLPNCNHLNKSEITTTAMQRFILYSYLEVAAAPFFRLSPITGDL